MKLLAALTFASLMFTTHTFAGSFSFGTGCPGPFGREEVPPGGAVTCIFSMQSLNNNADTIEVDQIQWDVFHQDGQEHHDNLLVETNNALAQVDIPSGEEFRWTTRMLSHPGDEALMVLPAQVSFHGRVFFGGICAPSSISDRVEFAGFSDQAKVQPCGSTVSGSARIMLKNGLSSTTSVRTRKLQRMIRHRHYFRCDVQPLDGTLACRRTSRARALEP